MDELIEVIRRDHRLDVSRYDRSFLATGQAERDIVANHEGLRAMVPLSAVFQTQFKKQLRTSP
jgi:hypothetical protein